MKKRILFLLFLFVLLTTATTAWLLNDEANRVGSILINYKGEDDNNLSIVNSNIDAAIYIQDNDSDEYVPFDDSFVLDSNRLIPNSIIPLQLRMKNNGTTDVKLKLTLFVEVDEKDTKLLDALYFESVAGSGFQNIEVEHIYYRLTEAKPINLGNRTQYALTIYGDDNKIIVPQGGDEVVLNCNFFFDSNADASYQDITFDIGYFRLEQ